WTNSDEHHVVSLTCGHLFGKQCILTWLSQQNPSKCPQCNKPAKKRDVIKLYTRCLKALDTSERDEALTMVRSLETKVQSLQDQLAKSEANNQLLSNEVEKLKKQLISNATSRPSTSINTH